MECQHKQIVGKSRFDGGEYGYCISCKSIICLKDRDRVELVEIIIKWIIRNPGMAEYYKIWETL